MFNALHFAIAGQWVMAGVAWALHSKGHPRTAYGLMLAVMLVFSWLAVRDASRPVPPAVQPENPDAVRVASFAVLSAPNAAKPYIASIRLDSKTYHLRTCTKYMPLAKVVREYDTMAEAEADKKQPCSFCIGRLSQGAVNVGY